MPQEPKRKIKIRWKEGRKSLVVYELGPYFIIEKWWNFLVWIEKNRFFCLVWASVQFKVSQKSELLQIKRKITNLIIYKIRYYFVTWQCESYFFSRHQVNNNSRCTSFLRNLLIYLMIEILLKSDFCYLKTTRTVLKFFL